MPWDERRQLILREFRRLPVRLPFDLAWKNKEKFAKQTRWRGRVFHSELSR